jgi:hypothetical protein
LWRALIARAIDANNEEVVAGTDMSPNEYTERFVQDGKQAVAKAIDGDDVERTAEAESSAPLPLGDTFAASLPHLH